MSFLISAQKVDGSDAVAKVDDVHGRLSLSKWLSFQYHSARCGQSNLEKKRASRYDRRWMIAKGSCQEGKGGAEGH